jgi:hypothetical protein
MSVLIDEQVPRTLDRLLSRLESAAGRGDRVEAWLFEGAAHRREAERRLAGRGVSAVFRSAYKPLLHFFLEETNAAALRRTTVYYPVREGAHDRRFQLEAYPLAGLLGAVEVRFAAAPGALHYRVELEKRGGARETRHVFAPNRARVDHIGERVLAPTGWLRITDSDGTSVRLDEAIETEYEAIFASVMDVVRAHDWGAREPYFEQLVVRADLPDTDERLPFGDECLSTSEALH